MTHDGEVIDELKEPTQRRARAVPRRRRSLRVADTATFVLLVASFATSGRPVAIHASVATAFTAALAWHAWLHRRWYSAVGKKLRGARSRRARAAAWVNVAIAVEATLALALGYLALGPAGAGAHGALATALLGIVGVHLLLNLRQLKALVHRRRTTCPSCGKENRVPVAATVTPQCVECRTDLPWLEDAGDADFDAAVRSPAAVLVDLWAPWCEPCKMVEPAVERASVELAGRLKVVKVNVDESLGISARFGVQEVPTLLVLRDGQVVARQDGALPTDGLVAWVHRAVDA